MAGNLVPFFPHGVVEYGTLLGPPPNYRGPTTHTYNNNTTQSNDLPGPPPPPPPKRESVKPEPDPVEPEPMIIDERTKLVKAIQEVCTRDDVICRFLCL
jgi:hypothetical protein